MLVKFCGFTRHNDLEEAARLGIDAAGFVFYPGSARYVTPEQAASLATALKGTGVARVGVFVDTPADVILWAVEKVPLDYLQLYDETLAASLASRCKIILARRVREGKDIPSVIDSNITYLLLDSWSGSSMGGSGISFDWSLISGGNLHDKTMIAGGINGENLPLLLEQYRPFGIDLSSGIEIEPGIKSHDKMKRIMTIVKEATNVHHA